VGALESLGGDHPDHLVAINPEQGDKLRHEGRALRR
jgi:hypothetical protein